MLHRVRPVPTVQLRAPFDQSFQQLVAGAAKRLNRPQTSADDELRSLNSVRSLSSAIDRQRHDPTLRAA